MVIKVSEDKELVERIRKQLQENGGYCPCRINRTEDTKCMCKEFLNQGVGKCHCGMYYKTEA